MRFLVRFCWALTLPGFLFTLFSTYARIKQTIGLQFGDLELFTSRGNYFFFFLTFFLVLNLTLYFLSQGIRHIPSIWLQVPNASFWTSSKELRKVANQILANWCWATAATANYFLMYWMLLVESKYHFEDGTITIVNWFYLPGYLMLVSLITPIFRLMIRNPDLLARAERD